VWAVGGGGCGKTKQTNKKKNTQQKKKKKQKKKNPLLVGLFNFQIVPKIFFFFESFPAGQHSIYPTRFLPFSFGGRTRLALTDFPPLTVTPPLQGKLLAWDVVSLVIILLKP